MRKQQRKKNQVYLSKFLFFSIYLIAISWLNFCESKTIAQVIPDNTTNTQVTHNDNITEITGGETREGNLFHSFQELSIQTDTEAFFNNPADISNIFSRVTGGNISNIDGLIRANGNANLFLINPAGIVFGENARLNIGGSFIGTTADSIQFEDSKTFATSDSSPDPVLTINRPIGLNFDRNPGDIVIQGNGNELSFDGQFLTGAGESIAGLRVQEQKNLAFVGGNILVDGGLITAPSGEITVGSIKIGQVNFELEKWNFDFSRVSSFKNIRLDNRAILDTSGFSGGNISLQGASISLDNGAIILFQSQLENSNRITINSTESLFLSGKEKSPASVNPLQQAFEDTASIGTLSLSEKGGDINISTKNLILRNGARIITNSVFSGISGNIKINAAEFIELSGTSSADPFAVVSGIFSSSNNRTGNINIQAQNFEINNGAAFISDSTGFGTGDISLNIKNLISLRGSRYVPSLKSTIPSSIVSRLTGFITSINTEDTLLSEPGSINIESSRLEILDGSTITTNSSGVKDAGKITINVSDSILLSGSAETLDGGILSDFPSSIQSSGLIVDPFIRDFLNLPDIPVGNANNIEIKTNGLILENNGEISVQNDGIGDAGQIIINVSEVTLDSGNISASTASGQGGNIILNSKNLELLDNSQINTKAENNGNGGNININTTSLLAQNNSTITANAVQGNGGNILIDTQGFFLFPDSSVTASSQFGIDGTVEINSLDRNLQKDLELDNLNLATTEEILEGSCLAPRKPPASFKLVPTVHAITSESLPDFFDSGSITGFDHSYQPSNTQQLRDIPSQPNESLIPANQAVKTKDGRIFLVAAPHSPDSLLCQL